jgi:soluble lytic murein transglycosylase-like protein
MKINPLVTKEFIKLHSMSQLDGLLTGQASSSSSLEEFSLLLEQLLVGNYGEKTTGTGMPEKITASPLNQLNRSFAFKSTSFDPIIEQASQQYKVDQGLIKAVIQTESSYNPHAVSHAGAKGLMQLMDSTARGLGVTDSFDPEQNIQGGTKFLGYLLKKYNGQEEVALAAYNAGPGRIDRLGIKTVEDLRLKWEQLPQETQNYIGKVIQAKS